MHPDANCRRIGGQATTVSQAAGGELDGVAHLERLIARAGYPSIVAAVAEHTVFLDPQTVAQTRGSALFPVIRNMARRGQIGETADGRPVMFDDNLSPTNAFLWATGVRRGRDVQFNHVWSRSDDPDAYTALWNLCVTPSFLAKTTDGSNHPEVIAALRYRAFDLYGALATGEPEPSAPSGYEALVWAPAPPPVPDLEAALRQRMLMSPKSRTTIACRDIGWLFSDQKPDHRL